MSVGEIKKALEGVTPGPWHVYSEKVADKEAAIAESAYQVEHTEPFVGEIFMLNAGGKCPALTGCGPCSEANARYIAAVNPAAISELLSTLERLQRENERLERERAKQWRRARRADASRDTYSALAKTFEAEANQMREVATANRHRAEAAEERVTLLEAALKPFSDLAECYDPDENDGELKCWHDGSIPKIKDLRRARSALASTGGEHHAE